MGPIAEHGDDAPAKPPTAASCNGCSWLSTVWPRSAVETLTYKAARLVAVATRLSRIANPSTNSSTIYGSVVSLRSSSDWSCWTIARS